MDISCAIMDVIETRDEFIKKRLIAKGISLDIIDEVFNKTDDVTSNDEEGHSDPVPSKRFLKPNSVNSSESNVVISSNSRAISKPTAQKSNAPQYEVKDKYPQDYSDGSVVLVLNYGKWSHALFGDFQKCHSKFRAFLNGNSNCSYNQNLTFGPGWVIKDKTKVGEIKKSLINQGIKYREIEMVEYQKEVQKRVTSKSSSGSAKEYSSESFDDTKIIPDPRKVEIKNKNKNKIESKYPIQPKTVSKTHEKSSGKILKNACGNYEEEGTGYIFMKLPVGKGGKDIKVCIGYQNPLLVEKGLASVSKLDTELQKDCSSRGHTVLTETMISLIRSKNISLADEIHEMWTREGDDESADAADTAEDTMSASDSE